MTETELRTYFEKDLHWGNGFQSRLVFDFLQRAAGHARGGAILDAGAGHQRYRPFFQECLYLGQEHPVAGAMNKGITKYDILCDVRNIPLRDDSLRAVLSTSSLEHMEYPDDFFRESFRTLMPGGGFFIQVPFMYLEHEIPYDFQRPTRYGLRRWFKQHGFENVTIKPASSSMYSAITIMNWALEQGSMIDMDFGTRLRNRLVRLLWPRMTWWLTRAYDQPPSDDTTLPIGWVASGFKPGRLPPSNVTPGLHTFLTERRLPETSAGMSASPDPVSV